MKLFFVSLLLFTSLWSMPSKLAVEYVESQFPFSYSTDLGAEGVLVDWWSIWGERNNVAIDFKGYETYTDLLKGLSTGNISIVAGLYYSDSLARSLLYSTVILRSDLLFYSQSSISLEQVSTYTDSVAVVTGGVAEAYLSATYSQVPLIHMSSFTELYSRIMDESIAAFVLSSPKKLMENDKRPRIRKTYTQRIVPAVYQTGLVLTDQSIRAAVGGDNDALVQTILIGAGNMTEDDLISLAKTWHFWGATPVVFIALVSIVVTLIIIIIVVVIRRKRNVYLQAHPTVEQIVATLAKGETDTVEFKSSLRYDYRQKCSNKVLEHVILKTLSAFMNSGGGVLVIGVDDEGEVLGLDNDYQSLNKKNSDGFLLALTALVNTQIGKKYHRYLQFSMLTHNNQEICWIAVQPSSDPVFMGKKGSEEFYIRASVSSQPLSLRECYEYIQKQWKFTRRQ